MSNAPPGTDYLSYAPWNEREDLSGEEEYNIEDNISEAFEYEETQDNVETLINP